MDGNRVWSAAIATRDALKSRSLCMPLIGRKAHYVCATLMVIAYPILMGYTIRREPSDLLFGVIIAAHFFAVYLVPLGLLQGKVEATDRGVSVERWRESFIAYSDVIGCYGLFLFPFQIAVLITKRRFPLTVVIACDEIDGRRRSLFQRGRLASSVTTLKMSLDAR